MLQSTVLAVILPIRCGCEIVLSRTMQVDVKPDIALPGSSWLTGHLQVNVWFADQPDIRMAL